MLYRNENNILSTFSAQVATMTESGIKHADAGWQERITAKEIGDEKPSLLGDMPIKFTGNYFVTFYTKH